jgi:hypothetical protein
VFAVQATRWWLLLLPATEVASISLGISFRYSHMRALHYTALALIIMLFATTAHAKWKPQYGDANPAIQQWYGDQHNSKGEWCCNKSDGHAYYGDVKILADGSIKLDGDYTVEGYKVLTGTNPTGHAVWWYTDVEGTRTTYCFAPGTLS